MLFLPWNIQELRKRVRIVSAISKPSIGLALTALDNYYPCYLCIGRDVAYGKNCFCLECLDSLSLPSVPGQIYSTLGLETLAAHVHKAKAGIK
jgi:hypothetical protein